MRKEGGGRARLAGGIWESLERQRGEVTCPRLSGETVAGQGPLQLAQTIAACFSPLAAKGLTAPGGPEGLSPAKPALSAWETLSDRAFGSRQGEGKSLCAKQP